MTVLVTEEQAKSIAREFGEKEGIQEFIVDGCTLTEEDGAPVWKVFMGFVEITGPFSRVVLTINPAFGEVIAARTL
ncbi:hypothetical protein [Aeoliella sp.]|uniref:hypothetical protein n=1 Tax=Aeoliella sp. TaxID=2795800 RepID=UPI003CCB9D02